jgi:hypothetical protein
MLVAGSIVEIVAIQLQVSPHPLLHAYARLCSSGFRLSLQKSCPFPYLDGVTIAVPDSVKDTFLVPRF